MYILDYKKTSGYTFGPEIRSGKVSEYKLSSVKEWDFLHSRLETKFMVCPHCAATMRKYEDVPIYGTEAAMKQLGITPAANVTYSPLSAGRIRCDGCYSEMFRYTDEKLNIPMYFKSLQE